MKKFSAYHYYFFISAWISDNLFYRLAPRSREIKTRWETLKSPEDSGWGSERRKSSQGWLQVLSETSGEPFTWTKLETQHTSKCPTALWNTGALGTKRGLPTKHMPPDIVSAYVQLGAFTYCCLALVVNLSCLPSLYIWDVVFFH